MDDRLRFRCCDGYVIAQRLNKGTLLGWNARDDQPIDCQQNALAGAPLDHAFERCGKQIINHLASLPLPDRIEWYDASCNVAVYTDTEAYPPIC